MDDAVAQRNKIGAALANGRMNTCYLNAVLQCLTHTVPLVEKLRESKHMSTCNVGCEGFCALCTLIEQIEFSLCRSGSVIQPISFWQNLKNISSNFQLGHQEDAHEFLQSLLYVVHSYSIISNTDNTLISLEEDSPIRQVFGGRLRSQLRCCSCGYFWDTFEPLLDLSLEVGEAKDLVDALKLFTKVEKIDPEIKFDCEGCKARVTVEKQLKLDQAPQVIAFHLKRFKSDSNGIDKIDDFVKFPLEIDLKPFLSSSEDEFDYELYAMVVHRGRISGGHYFGVIRTDPHTWHVIDDDKVMTYEQSSVLKLCAYILFYIKKGSSAWFSSLMESQVTIINLISDSEEDGSEGAESDQTEVMEMNEGKNDLTTEAANSPQPAIDVDESENNGDLQSHLGYLPTEPLIASSERPNYSSRSTFDKLECVPWKLLPRNAREFHDDPEDIMVPNGIEEDNKEQDDKLIMNLAVTEKITAQSEQLERPPRLRFRLSDPLQTNCECPNCLQGNIHPLKKLRKASPDSTKPQDSCDKEPKMDADKDME